MYNQTENDLPPFDGVTRLMLRIILVLGSPVAMVMTLVGAILRSGAIVEVVAEVPGET